MKRALLVHLIALSLLAVPAASSAAPSLALDPAFGNGGSLTFSASATGTS